MLYRPSSGMIERPRSLLTAFSQTFSKRGPREARSCAMTSGAAFTASTPP